MGGHPRNPPLVTETLSVLALYFAWDEEVTLVEFFDSLVFCRDLHLHWVVQGSPL